MISVELFDGTVLQFPEGTNQSVIDREAKKETLARRGGEPAPEPRGMFGNAAAFLTGSDREAIPGPFNLPLGLSSEKAAQMTALLGTTMSPERLKAGMQKIEPDVSFDQDRFGTLIARWPLRDEAGNITQYKLFYPNPKGLDVSDVMRVSGAAALATPVAKGLQALGLATRGLLGGATIGGTEAALVEKASSELTDAPFQFSDIPYGMVGGAGGEILGRTVQSLVALARSRGPEAIIDASGNLLPEYAAMVRSAGLDPSQVSAAVASDISNAVRSGVDPAQAGATAMSQGLPTPVPLTRGQISGSGGQQLFEDIAGKGGYGTTAEALMKLQRDQQQEALGQNLGQILERLRPGSAPITRGAGGEAAQAQLLATRQAEKARASGLYTEARASTAVIDPAAALDVADSMRQAYRSGFSPRTAPQVAGLLDDFDQVASTGDITQMMNWRQQVTSLGKGVPTVDSAAASRVLEAFDQKISDAIDQSLLAGDPTAVAKWGEAIRNYADFASKWKDKGGVLNLLTEEVKRDGARVLKVAPEQAADAIFGATINGLAVKTGLPRDLLMLRKNLPEDQWNAMRQEAFIRLMDTSRGAMRGGEQQISGANFKKAWENLTSKNPGVVNGLFTKGEQDLFSQFANVASRATNTLANTSNTTAAAAGIIQKLASSVGGTGLAQFLLRIPIAKGFTEAFGGARAIAATRGAQPVPRSEYTVGGAGMGSAAAASDPGRAEINRGATQTMRGLLALPGLLAQ